MATQRKQVTIHYRKFAKNASTGQQSLEQLIRSAMNAVADDGVAVKARYRHRLYTAGVDSLFVNVYQDSSDGDALVFGDILHFTQGHLQALCETADPDAPSVPVQQMRAPERSEYVHSQMFWMVKGDHAFVLQSLSLKTEHVENYFRWLLTARTGVMASAGDVRLDAKFDPQAVGGDLGDIQEIVVGGVAVPPAPTPSEAEDAENAPTESVREVVTTGQVQTQAPTGWAQATEVLRTLLGGDANVKSLMAAIPLEAELSVQVHIGYRTRKRQVNRAALHQLEAGLRHLPDSQLQIKAKGAKIAADGTIRLHHNANIKLIRAQDGESEIVGSLLDPADVLRAMKEAYNYLVSNGKIQEAAS
ncbi:MAG: hypothetical protein ACTHL8_02605 [Burkholderiaceae bacterium]